MRCLLLTILVAASAAAEDPPGGILDGSALGPGLQGGASLSRAHLPASLPPPDVPAESWNPATTEDGQPLFEGDIVLTPAQRASRKGVPSVYLWPGGLVRFAITSTSGPDRAVILAALRHWQERVCVTFREVAAGYSGGPHIRFYKSSGCWSYIGRVNRARGQPISIGAGCAQLGTVVHEVGHALGFVHEQSRVDRDQHVAVLASNVRAGKLHNFQVMSFASARGVPYDLGSVMHYGGFSFTSNGLPTLVTRQIELNGFLGNRAGLSHRDAQLANVLYACAAGCASPPACQNGGYVDGSCSCACPPNASGARCEDLAGSYYGDVCGDRNVTAPGTITWLNSLGRHCAWRVSAPAGSRVRVRFAQFGVFSRYGGRCWWDWAAVHLEDDPLPDQVACGTELRGQTLTSRGNTLWIEMHAFATSLQRGFSATVTFV